MAEAAISEDAAAAAGVLLPLIRRVAPGALEKAEIVEGSGLDTDEIREGLDALLKEGKIEETDDGYRLAGREAELSAAAQSQEESEEGASDADPATPLSVPGVQNGYRSTMQVTITYGGLETDEEAMARAAAMEDEIADLVHKAYPDSVVAIEVKRVEAYKPRVIFQEDAGGDGAEG